MKKTKRRRQPRRGAADVTIDLVPIGIGPDDVYIYGSEREAEVLSASRVALEHLDKAMAVLGLTVVIALCCVLATAPKLR